MAHRHDEHDTIIWPNARIEITQQILAEVPLMGSDHPLGLARRSRSINEVPGIICIHNYIRLRRGSLGNDRFVVLITLWCFIISPVYKILWRYRGKLLSK